MPDAKRPGALAVRARFLSDVLLNDAVEPWTGPVERRDPRSYQRPSEHLTWMCANPHCRQWTMNGAWRWRRCNFCNTPRPSST